MFSSFADRNASSARSRFVVSLLCSFVFFFFFFSRCWCCCWCCWCFTHRSRSFVVLFFCYSRVFFIHRSGVSRAYFCIFLRVFGVSPPQKFQSKKETKKEICLSLSSSSSLHRRRRRKEGEESLCRVWWEVLTLHLRVGCFK